MTFWLVWKVTFHMKKYLEWFQVNWAALCKWDEFLEIQFTWVHPAYYFMRRKYKIGPFIQGKAYLEVVAEFIFAFNQFDDFQISDSNG